MIRQVLVDCDGTLTNGQQYVAIDGSKLFKAFHSRDIAAIRDLVNRGVRVIVLSADDWQGAIEWAHRVGAEFVYTRDKLDWAQAQGFSSEDTVAIGDDAWDVPLLQWFFFTYCPADAAECVLDLPGIDILRTSGGWGVLAEVLGSLQKRGLL